MRRIYCEGIIQDKKRIACLAYILEVSNTIVSIVEKLWIIHDHVLRQFHHHKWLHSICYKTSNARHMRGGLSNEPLGHYVIVVHILSP